MNPSEPTDQAAASLSRKLVGDSVRYIPGVILPAAAALAMVAVFTRIFDANVYGRYAIVIATTGFATQLAVGWIQASTLRYLPRYRSEGRLDEFIAEIRSLLLVLAIAFLVVVLPLYSLLPEQLEVYRPFFLPAALVVVSELLLQTAIVVYQGALRPGAYAAGRASAAVLRLALGLLLVLAVSRSVVSLVYAIAAANLLVAIPLLVGLRSKVFRARPSRAFVRTFAAFGLPLMGWMMCNQVLQLSDRYIIGAFRGSAEVGIYSANYNIVVMGFGMVSTPILLAVHPLLTDAWEHNRHDDIPQLIARFSRYYLIAIAPVLAFVSVFSVEIVSIVLGESFREGHHILPILLAGVLVWGMSAYGNKSLELTERARTLLVLILIAAITNVILNLIIVPRYGYTGAAYTTVASFTVYTLLLYPVSRPSLPWHVPWLGAARIALCTAGVALVLWVVRAGLEPVVPPWVYLIAAGVVGLAAYVGLLFATRALRRGELSDLD